jgi:thioredoxin-related protein
MLRILSALVFSVLFLTASSFSQSESTYKPVTEFDPSRNPAEDVKEAAIEAQRTNKRIILDVGGDWCIWCHRLDDFIKKNEEINNFLHKNFILVKVNFSKENKNEEFLSKYPEIPGYPHFFVLEKNGELLHSQNTGELEQDKGYSKEKMMTFFKNWASL